MKNILLIILFLTSTSFTNNSKDYIDNINYALEQLNFIRKNIRYNENILKDHAKIFGKNRKCDLSKWEDSLFVFTLNQKLCDEALKRCNKNSKINGIKNPMHKYPFENCKESIGMSEIIGEIDIKKELKNLIYQLIIDYEPTLIGHREMLLEKNENFKYIGFGYIIEKYNDRHVILLIILTSSIEGINNPINFNDGYFIKSKEFK